MRTFLIGGGNLGDVRDALDTAQEMIASRVGRIEAASRDHESEPWGFEAPQNFLNRVWMVETPLEPLELLDRIETIERELGREHKGGGGYRSRTMDIDILFYGDLVMDTPRLKIPHPLLHEREFVLRPLREVASGTVHPVLGLKIDEL
jgi:2-amino-4-hydroxy-6-hydroxymethyldihydropteridine diphosphokinase